MLVPVYQLLFGLDNLALTSDQVDVHYITYSSDDLSDMQTISAHKLTPGKVTVKELKHEINSFSVASVESGHNGQEHAMVLDNFDRNRNVFVFKNTYDDPSYGQPKKFEIKRTDPNAPKNLYFVHIEIKDMNNLPSQSGRVHNKREEIKTRQKSHTKAMNPVPNRPRQFIPRKRKF